MGADPQPCTLLNSARPHPREGVRWLGLPQCPPVALSLAGVMGQALAGGSGPAPLP